MALYIRKINNKGRGVFSTCSIRNGDLIETCPVIVIADLADRQLLKNTVLDNYLFRWGSETLTQSALALGYGSLYNHAQAANACYVLNQNESTIAIYCVRDIAAHEEITINYNGEPDAPQLTWFEDRNLTYHH